MYNKLARLTEGVYPFHMPGHKRNPAFLKDCPDITEITGADDLHHPEGMILSSERRAAEFFGVKKTYYSTAGSTSLILAAIGAAVKGGGNILIARNCHRSVYNAVLINSLKAEYIMPETVKELGCFGTVSKETVAAALKRRPASAVVITSPTYEGFVSDIKGIAEAVHQNGALLIVDAAHGAHLGLSDCFLPSARTLGADIVIESAHKTLPCLTGAALMHICSDAVDEAALGRAFSVYVSSSPSYPIMASIDYAVKELRFKGENLFRLQSDRLDDLWRNTRVMDKLSLFRREDHDKSKIIISCKNAIISGFKLKRLLLEEHKIECEMAMPDYLLALSTLCDTNLGFDKLTYALCEIDKRINRKDEPITAPIPPSPTVKMSIREATESASELLPIGFSVGRVSADFVYAYPPGSPIIAPGEIITASALSSAKALAAMGANVYSSSGDLEKINCVK